MSALPHSPLAAALRPVGPSARKLVGLILSVVVLVAVVVVPQPAAV